jgi:2-polyprenyl-3-methyl-5-hydroxy-6-metoxy-1,4-benzoquinol methylase
MLIGSRGPQFDFGENWREFSRNALDVQKVTQASNGFHKLLAGVELRGATFLDIGFGQGLGLLNAASVGALPVGCDINAKCVEVLEANRRFFPELLGAIPTVVGSILDDNVVQQLRELSPTRNYSIVHSWGALHHTGDMQQAIANAAKLVKPKGYLIIAIYNRHWSSLAWLAIKRAYVGGPLWLKKLEVAVLTPVIYLAKFIVTARNPMREERGMDFRYDVIDWVGGYPYEYASQEDVIETVGKLGFDLVRCHAARVPTGCNEFIFRNKSEVSI